MDQVKLANEWQLPFLAVTSAYGSINSLRWMQNGIQILMDQLNSVEIAQDGKTARIGGGAMSSTVTNELWAAGKQTGEFTVPNITRIAESSDSHVRIQ